jgi:tRNA(adenine34) deaminase
MNLENIDQYWMNHALSLARRAEEIGEVPIGAVIVIENEMVGEGWNQPISTSDPTAHAEIIALRQAAKRLSNYRLLNATLFVTLEPCAMCAGAMLHSRIKRLVFGASDPRTGAAGSVLNLLKPVLFNHTLEYNGGIMSDECGEILKMFFQARR